jgi:hypothetical protein
MATIKGFIKDWQGKKILPITRGELVLDCLGNVALTSDRFLAGELKDADGNIIATNMPGLITAAERAMLSGGGSGNSLSDLYTKVGYINTGLSFGGTTLNFYNNAGTATPISITASTGINIGVQGNTVALSLAPLATTGTEISNILKSIKVDKYGRVTAVTGSALTNSEIPATLTGKTLSGATLTNCTTSNKEIGTDEKAVANKAYVDAKFTAANTIATGALKFGGPLSDTATANSKLTDINALNSYYIVTAAFDIAKSNLYGSTSTSGTVTVKEGDTIIIHKPGSTAQFVHVPSGDDITSLTVVGEGETSNALTKAIGDLTLKFSSLFSVTNVNGGNTATVSLKAVTDNQDGYLTSTDYKAFKAYAQSLAVTYTGEFSSGDGVYKIGTLKIGNKDNVIYGKNNVSSLSLTNGATNAYNPILKFTETGATAVQLTLKGVSGIQVKKNGNSIEFNTNIGVKSDSTSYLTSDGTNVGVKLGSLNEDGTCNEGLVNYTTLHTLAQNVAATTVFEEISYTLTGTDDTKYKYGNAKLKTAITVTI